MSNKRPPISLALDIRGNETVHVITDPQAGYEYPPNWIVHSVGSNVPHLEYDEHGCSLSVVILDRVEILRRELAELLVRGPRILAVCVASVDHEKWFRWTLRALQPWSEVWETHTDFGKVLMTTAYGQPYDREKIVDLRPAADA